ncbi:MAG TPA: hypothetical protein VKT49_15790 [Bryobacteraceae bacterium]|nr:hypothetical protein [Bryobacteraceae bacterium]
MKSRLLAAGMAALIAASLSGCTRDYLNGKDTNNGGILRPGEAGTSTGERVAANDTAAATPNGLAPLGPAGPPSHAINPDAPKQSNGGSGSDYGSGFSFESASSTAPAR